MKIQVLEHRFEELLKKVNTFNKKSEKLGLENLIQVHQVGSTVVELGNGWVQVYLDLEIEGKAPVISGYTFLSKIEHTEVGNLVWNAPDFKGELPLHYRSAEPTCDHCKTSRKRKDTFVLREDATGALIRVGRSCLADFLRTGDVSGALSLFSLMKEVKELTGDDINAPVNISLIHFLACSARAIELFGWISKKDAYGANKESTSDSARYIACPCPPESTSYKGWSASQPTEKDFAEAEATLAWVASLEGANDYERNLKIVVAMNYVSFKHMGIAASAVAMYRRHLEKEVQKAHASKMSSEHFGKVGTSYLRKLTVIGYHAWETQWGMTHLYMMQDDLGNKFKWFASKKCFHPHEEERGIELEDDISFAFTIKSHGDYQGVKETVITRAVACKDTSGIKWIHGETGEIFKTKKALLAA